MRGKPDRSWEYRRESKIVQGGNRLITEGNIESKEGETHEGDSE